MTADDLATVVCAVVFYASLALLVEHIGSRGERD
jgi:hypothetical protein